MSDKPEKTEFSERRGMAGPASILLLAIVLCAGTLLTDSSTCSGRTVVIAAVPGSSDTESRSREPAGSDSAGDQKENVKSNPGEPEKRRKFRRCTLGDFKCYDDTAERLAGQNPFAPVSPG